MAALCRAELPGEPVPDDLTTLGIEELMNLSVTTVSKRPQKLSDAAAAVFVITQEDIRRSGATHIVELLRMVPGIQVARFDANKWAVTSRGFNGRFANKLLVLFDGRSVYTPLFSGVFWSQQDYLLEDIERIEVIRGPGASLWGANAVNGVINIITRRARNTQGALVTGSYGTQEEGVAGARYGGRLGEDTTYRVFGKTYHHEGFERFLGDEEVTGWHRWLTGFRVDHDASPRDSLTLQGELADRRSDEYYLVPSLTTPSFSEEVFVHNRVTTGDLLLRWQHTFSPSSSLTFQTYYDGTDLEDVVISERLDIVDFDLQHQFKPAGRHTFLWGVGYRFARDRIEDSEWVSMDTNHHRAHLFSAFAQDEIQLVADRLNLILGTKVEHNEHTGFELQPNARVLWTPLAHHTFWAAASRAVRTPSWIEEGGTGLSLTAQPPGALQPFPILTPMAGSDDFRSETLQAFELGYRFQPTQHLSLDATAFYNVYDDLRSLEFVGDPLFTPSPVPHLIWPLEADNKLEGATYGMEVAADWRVFAPWRLQAAYSFIQMELRPWGSSTDAFSAAIIERTSPHHQVSLRSWTDLSHDVEFDLWLRFVDALPALDIEEVLTLDARLAWKPTRNLELSLVGQNLLDNEHIEAKADFLSTVPSEIERSVYMKCVVRF